MGREIQRSEDTRVTNPDWVKQIHDARLKRMTDDPERKLWQRLLAIFVMWPLIFIAIWLEAIEQKLRK